MDDPINDIEGVIYKLSTGTPAIQAHTLRKYFTKDASFIHPFCRTGSFKGSRDLMGFVYRWYKIMSPTIEVAVDSVAFDQKNLLLYVTLHQTFSIWALPFHHAHVNLTTVLSLTKTLPAPDEHTLKLPPQLGSRPRYFIHQQNDLYQTNEFIRFLLPWLGFGNVIVLIWQFTATVFCVAGCFLLYPVTWLEQEGYIGQRQPQPPPRQNIEE